MSTDTDFETIRRNVKDVHPGDIVYNHADEYPLLVTEVWFDRPERDRVRMVTIEWQDGSWDRYPASASLILLIEED